MLLYNCKAKPSAILTVTCIELLTYTKIMCDVAYYGTTQDTCITKLAIFSLSLSVTHAHLLLYIAYTCE